MAETADMQPRPLPPEQIAITTFGQETPAQGEMERIKNFWREAIREVGTKNRALVERGYASKETVTKDLESQWSQQGKPWDANSPETATAIETEIKRREQEQQDVLDPNKIPDLEVQQKAQELVKTDKYQGKAVNDAEVTTAAREEIINERRALQRAFETLYEIEAIIQAAEKAVQERIEQERNKLIELAKKQKLTELQLTNPTVTVLPPEETRLIEERFATLAPELQQEIRNQVTAEWYDAQSGVYYRIGTDGKPDKNQPLHHDSTYEPILQALAKTSTSRVQKILDNLKLVDNPDPNRRGGKAFLVRSAEEVIKKETEEAEAFVLKTALGKFEDLLGKQAYTTSDGKIDEEKLKEYLKKLKESGNDGPNEAVLSLSQLLGIYLETSPGQARENILAVIYSHLESIDPNCLNGLSETGRKIFTQRIKRIEKTVTDWFIAKGYQNPPEVPLRRLLKYLVVAHVIQSQNLFERNPNTGQLQFTDSVRKYLQNKAKWGEDFNPEDENTLLFFASNIGYPDTFVFQNFGIEIQSLLAPQQRVHYADRVVEELAKDMPESTEEEKAVKGEFHNAYQQVAHFHVSADSLSAIAKKRNIPPEAIIYGSILLALFAPSIQGLMSLDVQGREDEGGGH